ncbi:MAG: glycosyltransferase, partial [Gammaproteobacteria bacterium]|nr:glycosyltransferase [Gammaproteobacteria bacterium]
MIDDTLNNWNRQMRLTIAIPTYNRSARLEKALVNLCAEINSASKKSNVTVYVSNNGSTDDTDKVISQCSKLFIESGIPFSSSRVESNQGFDAN